MTRARAAVVGAATLVPALLLGAGDAAGERAAGSPAQTVTSADGGLTVGVPAGALPKPVRVRVRTLSRGQYPPEVRNAKLRPGTKVYALEPSGTRFLKPVTITRRLDTKLAGFKVGAVPGIVLATRDSKATWELLKSLQVRLDGRTAVISGTTRHFSTLLSLDQGFSLTLVPSSINAQVGDTWVAVIGSNEDRRRRSTATNVDTTAFRSSGAVEKGRSLGKRDQEFVCAREGTGFYVADVTVVETNLVALLATVSGSRFEERFYLSGAARCRAKAPPPPTTARLVAACVAVVHTPLGPAFPSFLRWLLQFSGAASARAELTVGGMNNQQPVAGTVGSNSRVELQGGITSFGPKQVQRLGVAGVDMTSQLVSKVGAAPVVTSEQRVIAGTCP